MKLDGAASAHVLPDALARAIESAKVPPLPQALLKLLQLAEDDATSMSELATVVEQDPGLCARVLTAANSPGLRRGSELRGVAHCLTSLGTRLIRSIATCLSLQSMFDRRHDTIRTDLTQFWRHSLSVAESSRELAVASAYPHPDDAYLAGLLHDVGELVLLSALGGTYAQVLTLALNESTLASIESERLGVHHGEVGAWLVDRWKVDVAIGDGILFHHATADEIVTASSLPQIIWMAHALATAELASSATVALATQMFGPGVAAQLDRIALRARERTERIAEAIGIAAADHTSTATPASELPLVAVAMPRPADSDADSEIEAIMRDMALMQPLQRDLFGIDSDVELLLSLRESARILFDLSHIAIFLRGADDNCLSAARFGEQPPLFRQATIRADAPRCLVAAAASTRRIVSTFDDGYAQPPALIDVQFARAFGTEGLLCVPMSGRSHSVGVMAFGLSSAQYGRLKRRLPWVLNFGRIAGLSLDAWHEAIGYRKRAEDDAAAHFQRQARRVVHEAGNPLGIIKSYLRILDGKLPESIEVRQELGVLREEIDRVASIVGRMSEFPQHAAGPAGHDAGELVRELLALYGAALFTSRGIDLKTAIAANTEAVVCDRDGLKQILLNLIKNASEAMGQGDKLRVEVADGVVHNGRRFVEILIDDSGPGLPAAAIRSLASPDEIKTEGNRGMGLAIVSEIAARIGVSLICRNRPQSGTSISLLLPCLQPALKE